MSRKITVAGMVVAAAVGLAPAVPAAAHVGDTDRSAGHVRHVLKAPKQKLTTEQKAAIATYKAAVRAAHETHRLALRAVRVEFWTATADARQALQEALAVATTRAERRAAMLVYHQSTQAARVAAGAGVKAANQALHEAHEAALEALKQALAPVTDT